MKLSGDERGILIDALMVLMHERERLIREEVNEGDLAEEQALLDRLMFEPEEG